jgi:hypothetical protein
MSRFIVALFISGTMLACSHMEKMDEAYTSTDPAFQKSFSKPKSDCISASVTSLKEMGIGIEEKTDTKLITERYDAYKFVVTNGSVSNSGSVNTSSQLNSQQAKIYLNFSPDGEGCKVNIAKVRAWNNGQEFEKIDVDFTKKMVATPFFTELTERLNR